MASYEMSRRVKGETEFSDLCRFLGESSEASDGLVV